MVFAGIDHPSIPYDYIIFKSNNTFYAVGTKPGYIDFYETTKAKVINAILAKYPTFTGTIYDKENNEVRSYDNGVLITTFPVIKQSPQETASYIIFKDGDYICAKNGSTGKIDYRDTDAATVIQSVISGKLIIKRGKYIISETIYVQNKENLVIEGESWETKLVTEGDITPFVVGKDGDEAYASKNIIFRSLYFDCSSQSDTTTPPENYGLELRHAIAVAYGCSVRVENCYFYNVASDAIYGRGLYEKPGPKVDMFGCVGEKLRGYWAMFHVHYDFYNTDKVMYNLVFDSKVGVARHAQVIVGNVMYNIDIARHDCIVGTGRPVLGNPEVGTVIVGNAIYYLKGNGGGIQAFYANDAVIGNLIVGDPDNMPSRGIFINEGSRHIIAFNRIENVQEGIVVRNTTDTSDIVIFGNYIGNVKYDGILCDVTDSSKAQRHLVAYNVIDGVSVYDCMRVGGKGWRILYNILRNANRRGIFTTTYSDGFTIEQNIIEGVGEPIYLAGVNHRVRRNEGYLTENSGVATLSGDGTTTDFLIGEHGLSPSIDDPSKVIVKVTPASADAVAASPCVGYLSDENADGVYESIRVKFASAPASGTDNVRIVWMAEVR